MIIESLIRVLNDDLNKNQIKKQNINTYIDWSEYKVMDSLLEFRPNDQEPAETDEENVMNQSQKAS